MNFYFENSLYFTDFFRYAVIYFVQDNLSFFVINDEKNISIGFDKKTK